MIDRSATSQNVYMLSQIDENDLSEFLDKDSTATVVTPQPDKSKVVLDETNNEDVDKEATIDPEKTASAKTNMGAMATILILALGGVAAYSHILDDDRRKNAELFEEAFYEKKNLDPQMHVQQENNNATVADEVDPELLAKVLANPEMRALLNSLAKTMK